MRQRMRRPLAALLCVALLAMTLVVAVAPAAAEVKQRAPEGDVIPGRYIVTLKPSAPAGAKSQRLRGERGLRIRHVYDRALNGFAADLTDAELAALRADPEVVSITPDYALQLFEDTLGTGIRRSEADTNPAAGIGTDTNPVAVDVAVIDTGVDVDHPDLNVVGGVNCSTDGSSSYDDVYGHGTHVAGIIGALDNGSGVVGVAPGARIWSVRVFKSDGNGGITGDVSDLICGVNWVTAHADTIEVANMSVGAFATEGSCTDGGLHQAICQSVAVGVTYVAAAGNSAWPADLFVPANFSQVITVSALTDTDGLPGGFGPPTSDPVNLGSDDRFAPFSNYGADVDLAAPGVDIYSTWMGGGYASASGTSMAAPHVTGAAALYLLQHPGTSPAAVRQSLVTMGWAQESPNGFSGDRDSYHEPLLNAGDNIDPVEPPPPSCSLSVASGPYATPTTITCQGFEPAEYVYVYWDGATYFTKLFLTDANGAGTVGFTVPEGAFGERVVRAVGQKSGAQATTIFTMQPSVALSRTSGAPGASLSATLKGFGAMESVTVSWDGVPVKTVATTAKGSGSAFFVVPAAPAGAHTVSAVGATSGATASATFSVTQSLMVSPTTGQVGSTATATAKGFSSGSVVTVSFAGASVGQATVDSTGTAVVSFVVPEAAKGARTVQATGSASGQSATATYTVRERLTTNITAGTVGDALILTMTGYAAGETINIVWYEGTTLTTIATTTASALGSASVTVAVPEGTNGSHKVAANGVSSGAVPYFFFFMKAGMTLDRTAGPAGTVVTATVTGYRAGEVVTIKWYINSYTPVTVATSGPTSAKGTVSVSFTVPAGATLGAHKVESIGGSSYARANMTFTVQ